MPMVRDIQTSFTSGEFDPLLRDRVDVTFYTSACQLLENVYVMPQGGIRQRAGMCALMHKRKDLSAITLSGTGTAPQGGTAGNATDGDTATVLLTTGNLGTVDPYVVWHYDHGSAVEPDVIDTVDAEISDESEADLAWQYSDDDASWTTAGTITLGGTARSRRLTAGPGSSLGSHRYWRLARLGGTDLGTAKVQVAEIAFLAEGSTIGVGKGFKFTVDADTEYGFVLTAGNIDIVRMRPAPKVLVASVKAPYAEADVANVKVAQSRDLMLFFHQDYAPYRVFRQGSDSDWDFRDQVFDSTTMYAWGDAYVSGGINEEQRIRLSSVSSGDVFRFELDGEHTDDITAGASSAANVSLIETGLESFDQITDVAVSELSSNNYKVEFQNEDGKQAWPIMVAKVITGSGTIEILRIQGGEPDKAPLWDANHGYPRDGTFYQGRLWMTGFRDRPGATVGSRVGSFFDFEEDVDVANGSPLFFEADTDEQVTCYAIHAGRHLQIFTSSGEFYIPSEPIIPTNVSIKQTSRIGSEPGVPTLDIEGATLFVGRNGESLLEYLFVDTEQSYQSNLVSLLAGHLVKSPRDMAFRRRQDTDEPNLYLLANTGTADDGSRAPSAIITILRAQQVTAFARWTTPGGNVEGVLATQGGDVLTLVDRTIDGTDYSFVEVWDDDAQLDGGAIVENPDVDTFTASGAGPYTYTFTAADASEVVVHVRDTATGIWSLVDSDDYTLDLGAKTVTLDTAQSSGQVRICKPMLTVDLTTATAHLDGVSLRVVVDGFDDGDATPSGSTITLATAANFMVEFGFHFTAEAVPLPYRPDTPAGRPLAITARIPHLGVSVYRTGGVKAGLYGQTLGAVDMELPTTGVREARLATGTKRMWGIAGWALDAAPHIRRDLAEDMIVRSLVYDLRW